MLTWCLRTKKLLNKHQIIFNYLWHQKKIIFNSLYTTSLFIWDTRWGKGSFRIKVLTLVQNITEYRLRHSRVLFINIASVTYTDGSHSVECINYSLVIPVNRQKQSDGKEWCLFRYFHLTLISSFSCCYKVTPFTLYTVSSLFLSELAPKAGSLF